jgi:TatA/E family protein of Tat protein translocase
MFRSPVGDGLIVLVILLLFVGPKRLPMLSRSIGQSIKEFKGGISDHDDDKQLDSAASSESAQPAEKRDTVA